MSSEGCVKPRKKLFAEGHASHRSLLPVRSQSDRVPQASSCISVNASHAFRAMSIGGQFPNAVRQITDRISQTSERMHQSICTFLGVVPTTNQCAMLLLFLQPATGWRSRIVCAGKTRQ